MPNFPTPIGLDQPSLYEICIQGRIESELSDWFQGEPGIHIETSDENLAVTVWVGYVFDQAALHGLLAYIRNLGMTLLYVDCLSARDTPSQEE